MASAYLRFVTHLRDERSLASQGAFQAAYELKYEERLEEHERLWFEDLLRWFDEHLEAPPRWRLGRGRAVCWFKDSAVEHLRQGRHLAVMLAHHGVPCRLLRTRKPGRILYEDPHQVAAVPFRDGVR
jgi:hypothetical protein